MRPCSAETTTVTILTRSSAITEGPRAALCQLKLLSCWTAVAYEKSYLNRLAIDRWYNYLYSAYKSKRVTRRLGDWPWKSFKVIGIGTIWHALYHFQLPSGLMATYLTGVRGPGPRLESHDGQLCLSRQPGTRCTPLSSVLTDAFESVSENVTLLQCHRSTQLSSLRGTVKRVSALGMSDNNNIWRWWMRMVAAFSGWLIVQVGWHSLHSPKIMNQVNSRNRLPWRQHRKHYRCRRPRSYVLLATFFFKILSLSFDNKWPDRNADCCINIDYKKFTTVKIWRGS